MDKVTEELSIQRAVGQETWVPWESDYQPYKIFQSFSALETLGTRYRMTHDTLGVGDGTILVSRKFGSVDRLYTTEPADHDFHNAHMRFAMEAAKLVDRMYLVGPETVSGVGMYTEGSCTPIVVGETRGQSLYKGCESRFQVTQTSDVRGLLTGLTSYIKEPSGYRYRPGIIAHPVFRKMIRAAGDIPGEFNGVKIFYTTSSRLSEEVTTQPQGHPLLFVGNVADLLWGVRSGPESSLRVFDDSWAEEATESDPLFLSESDAAAYIAESRGTSLLKTRVRRGFNLGPNHRFHCIELT